MYALQQKLYLHLLIYSEYLLCFIFKAACNTEIYTLSLHDALPIFSCANLLAPWFPPKGTKEVVEDAWDDWAAATRSEEHTSELQSHHDLVCRLLLEKKNIDPIIIFDF